VGSEDIRTSTSGEISLGGFPRDRWHTEYLGCVYRSAVEMALAHVASGRPAVLKTDLWNEVLGGPRDIAGHFQVRQGCRFFGVDLVRRVCVQAHSRLPTVQVVQADIRSLPFRAGSFDAVLDLSTLDHLPDAEFGRTIDEYRRVLRNGGVLLVVFWQRSIFMRQRLFLKRLLGRRENPDQYYFPRASVRASLGSGLMVVREFVAGLPLIPPHPLTNLVLGVLPPRALRRFLQLLVVFEGSSLMRPVLKHVAGLYGIAALWQWDAPDRHPGVK
jgi:SAM-dependent methyltransferase